MPTAFYRDEHVQQAISRGLRRRGVDVLTVQEDGMLGHGDSVLLDRAETLGRVLFTRDRDFLAIAAHRQAAGVRFAGVVYAHSLLVGIGRCVSDLELIAFACEPVDMADRVEHLPL